MSRPRVVHVYKDVYPPVEGGIERTIYHLARLTRDDFDPSVICASRSRRGGVRAIDGDIEVTEVPCHGRLLSNPIAPGFVQALRASRADLLHFHFPHPMGEVAFLMSGLRTPAVVTYHSDIVRQKGALILYRPLMHRFLARMKTIMPTTQRYLDTSPTLARHRDRCRVVALGLPLEDYEAGDAIRARAAEHRREWGDYVLFLGCLRRYKGLRKLIGLGAELVHHHVAIAGEGPEKADLIALARKNGLQNRVHFLGRVDQPSALALLHGAAVFCLPAVERSEAFGLCQIEAMTCGVPVVSTDLPTGVPEVNRDGETGLIVPPDDLEALTFAVRDLLENPDLRRRLGEGGRRRAAQFYNATLMAERVSQVYRDALKSVA